MLAFVGNKTSKKAPATSLLQGLFLIHSDKGQGFTLDVSDDPHDAMPQVCSLFRYA